MKNITQQLCNLTQRESGDRFLTQIFERPRFFVFVVHGSVSADRVELFQKQVRARRLASNFPVLGDSAEFKK